MVLRYGVLAVEGHLHAGADGPVFEARQQVAGAVGALYLQYAGQRIDPFLGFGRVGVAVGVAVLVHHAIRRHEGLRTT